MESTTFKNVFQATNFAKNPLLHDFFAGDSSPEIQIPYEVESSASDCESGVTGSSSTTSTSSATSSIRHRRRIIFDENLAVELTEGERSYELIRRRFLAGVGDTVDIVAVHRRNWSEVYSGPAKIQTFQLYARALESKYGGPPNIKFGWYGGDKHRIEKILAHGFSHLDSNNNDDNHALYLSPDDSPAQSVSDSGPDEDGLRHVLLCRVLLGESELVRPGSGQTYPSSGKFDSGVDSYDNPKNYVIWSTHMNTHILPEYVVTYKLNSADNNDDPTFSKGVNNVIKAKNGIKMPTSPWVSFPALIAVLAKYLAPDAISLINKYHKDYKQDRRITRPELIQKVRQIAGDKLLIAVIKSFKSSSKGSKVPLGSSYRRSNTNK